MSQRTQNNAAGVGRQTRASGNGHQRPDPKGRMPGEQDYNPFDNPDVAAKFAAEREAQAVTEARLKRWGARRYPVAVLDGRPDQWARKIAADVARRNAMRDPMSKPPTLVFSGDQAVNAGASDAEMLALRELSTGEIEALTLKAAAIREDRRAQARTLARKIAADRETTVAAPEPLSLADLLAEQDDGPTYRVKGVWPNAGRVLLAAQYKAGKSTTVGNAIRSLVDGDPFLGKFEVTPISRVALIDTELDTRTLVARPRHSKHRGGVGAGAARRGLDVRHSRPRHTHRMGAAARRG